MQLVAKTLFGLESVLGKEIEELGGKNVRVENRAVSYEGDMALLLKSNLWLRTAIAVLMPISTIRFKKKEDLIKAFSKLNFSEYMTSDQKFAVKGAVNSPEFTFDKYPMLLLKDAVVDHFMRKEGSRPNVDKMRPQIVFDLHISHDICTISLNSSGAPLFQRGYRTGTGAAPLNEVVAAGLILLSGWDGKKAFIDPFCGSGTLPIEAAMIAHGIAPATARKHFAFQHWKNFDKALWAKIKAEAPLVPDRTVKTVIIGSDTDGDVILKARQNVKALPLGRSIEFEVKDFKDVVPPDENGVLITNPPYGQRLESENLNELYKEIGDFFKHKLGGYECWVLSSDIDALKSIELKPSSKTRIFNGSLSCEFRNYTIFKGSLAEHKQGLS